MIYILKQSSNGIRGQVMKNIKHSLNNEHKYKYNSLNNKTLHSRANDTEE